jgi:hypothetical protein
MTIRKDKTSVIVEPGPKGGREIKIGGASYGGLMADMAKWGVVFAPEDEGAGGAGDEGAAGDEAPADEDAGGESTKEADKAKKPAGASETEKALRAELAKAKKQAAAFAGLTPEAVAELKAAKAEADKLKADAAALKKSQEEEALRKAGDFEALKARIIEEHKAETAGSKAKIDELQNAVDLMHQRVVQTTLTAAFAASRFVTGETVFSPTKAMLIYGSNFDVEDGRVVGYDAPKGAAKRTMLVDGRGQPLAFDEAIKRLVEADPDRDTVLRSKQKPGSGQQAYNGGKAPPAKDDQPRGVHRIAANLGSLNLPK